MNRVSKRVWPVSILCLLLIGGLGLFIYRYFVYGSTWVLNPGNPHLYNAGNASFGIITDRNGVFLYDSSEREYSEDTILSASTIHILGDRAGSISAPLLSEYLPLLSGYSTVNGLYNNGPGPTAVLTIDADAQRAAYNAMNGRKGTVAVYNYLTGEILCLVTSPSYDPNNIPNLDEDVDGVYEGVYLNRFFQCTYTPGSIFKIVTLCAALESVPGVSNMHFTCSGATVIGGAQITCAGTHGDQTLEKAFRNSCNCAFAELAQLVGSSTLSEYVKAFGLTDALKVDGITSAKGHFDLTNADAGALAWAGVGQYTDMVNPCSFLFFLGQVANNGSAAMPYLMKEISTEESLLYSAETQANNGVISVSTSDTVSIMMHNNVQYKYGAEKFPNVRICAKSGTAETVEGKKATALFAGFVDETEYPYAFIAIIEDVGAGTTNAAPVVSAVLDSLISK